MPPWRVADHRALPAPSVRGQHAVERSRAAPLRGAVDQVVGALGAPSVEREVACRLAGEPRRDQVREETVVSAARPVHEHDRVRVRPSWGRQLRRRRRAADAWRRERSDRVPAAARRGASAGATSAAREPSWAGRLPARASKHARPVPRAPGRRSGRSSRWRSRRRPGRRARARGPPRRAGRPRPRRAAPPSFSARLASVAGDSERGFRERVNTTRSTRGSSVAQHRRRRPCPRARRSRPRAAGGRRARRRATRRARAAPEGLWAPS